MPSAPVGASESIDQTLADLTSSIEGPDTVPPSLHDDSRTVRGTKTIAAATAGQGVLANDTDPDGDALTVTGVSAAINGAGSIGAPLAGQYGTLTLAADGTYSYTANNAAVLIEGLGEHDQFTYTAADQHGNSSTATLDVTVFGHAGGVMDIDSFTAVESVTGDRISGVLYDNTGRYTLGSSLSTGPDQLGGTWTYTINNIGRADNAHQDVTYSGLVYDFDYFDADTGVTSSTVYGHTGFDMGIADKTNVSGSNYLGSDGDLVVINGRPVAIASGRYVAPEGVTVDARMQAVTFQAKESVTGDVINGVLFDDGGRYTVGSSLTTGSDELGGQWTYTVTSLADADAKHQDLSYAGFVYDLSYEDVDIGLQVNTAFGSKGFASGVDDRTVNYSGNHYLGSDGDVVNVRNITFAVASGKYVVPEPEVDDSFMLEDHFTAVESKTGDTISGVLFDAQGLYSVGSTVTKGPDELGGTWTYTINSLDEADTAHQNFAYSGYVYDLTYYDADQDKAYNTFYGMTGLNTGINDRTQNYSGNNYLGSDGDLVVVNGSFKAVASGKYVLPEQTASAQVMQADGFRAVESVTGDVILGVVYDDTGRYSVGSTVTTTGSDNLGGNWTYTVTSIGDADAAHQDPSYSGYQYDYVYSDQDNDESVKTDFGAVGWDSHIGDRNLNYSGNNYLGLDGDAVHLGSDYAVASGKYVMPENIGEREAVARADDITVKGGTQFDLDGRLDYAGNVTFAAATGMLQIEQASMFDGTISGFDAHDGIDLVDISFGPTTTLGYTANSGNTGGTLTVNDGFHSANLALLGNYTAANFAVSSDSHGGTLVSDAAVSSQMLLAQPAA
jgi:VCBS repeat-containing protein